MTKDFSRFCQRVRSEVRGHVARTGEAPKLTMWCSEGDNPRRIADVQIGAAVDRVAVLENVRTYTLEAAARWMAIGRLLLDYAEVPDPPTFALYCASADEGVVLYLAEVEDGSMGAWVENPNLDPDIVELMTGSLRAVARAQHVCHCGHDEAAHDRKGVGSCLMCPCVGFRP